MSGCKDRMCGADDCDTCRPGNSWQSAREAIRREAEEARANAERDRWKDREIEVDVLECTDGEDDP